MELMDKRLFSLGENILVDLSLSNSDEVDFLSGLIKPDELGDFIDDVRAAFIKHSVGAVGERQTTKRSLCKTNVTKALMRAHKSVFFDWDRNEYAAPWDDVDHLFHEVTDEWVTCYTDLGTIALRDLRTGVTVEVERVRTAKHEVMKDTAELLLNAYELYINRN